MKTIMLWVGVLLFLALGSCTETIYEEVIKLDTVFVSKSQSFAPTFITVTDTVVVRDTVEIRVVIHDVDTVIQYVTKDSLIIKEVEKIVYHTDTVRIVDTVVNNILTTDTIVVVQRDTTTVTVYDRTVVYFDTAYVMIYMRNVTSIPEAIQPHVNEFYGLASQYGKLTIGGHMIVQYTDDLPGENWVSHSYWVGGPASIDNPYAQMVIEISESLPTELHRASILRELGRLQLKRKYTVVPDKIMNPLFGPAQTITTTHLNDLFSLPI